MIMKVRFSAIADAIFYAACPSLLLFCILRYERVPVAASAAIAALVLLGIAAALYLILEHRKGNRLNSRREEEEMQALMLHFTLEQPARVREQLQHALQAAGKEAQEEGEGLRMDGKLYLPAFSLDPLSADSLAAHLRAYGQELALFCNTLSPQAETLCRRFSVTEMRGTEIYRLLKDTENIPAPLLCGELPTRSRRERLHIALSRKNARPFFISGFLLLIMSLFVLYPVYYLWTGGILLVLSVVIRIFGAKDKHYA